MKKSSRLLSFLLIFAMCLSMVSAPTFVSAEETGSTEAEKVTITLNGYPLVGYRDDGDTYYRFSMQVTAGMTINEDPEALAEYEAMVTRFSGSHELTHWVDSKTKEAIDIESFKDIRFSENSSYSGSWDGEIKTIKFQTDGYFNDDENLHEITIQVPISQSISSVLKYAPYPNFQNLNGMTFDFWKRNVSDIEEYSILGDGMMGMVPPCDMTFTASYKSGNAADYCVVQYHPNGGVFSAGIEEPVMKEYRRDGWGVYLDQDEPTKEGCLFAGWSSDPEGSTGLYEGGVTSFSYSSINHVYAIYRDYENYTVTWKNYDGSTLEVDENVRETSMPSYDGETPVKPSEGYYDYRFIGWSPEISEVTGDKTYTAQYEICNYCGDNAYWQVVDNALIISGTGNINDYAEEPAPWSGIDNITSIRINEGITKVGIGAFSGMTEVSEITIFDTVTEISKNAFENCEALTDVYYSGTQDEWNGIRVNVGNDPLTNARLHLLNDDRIAQVIYTEGNNTLTFLYGPGLRAGDNYNGQTVTTEFTDFSLAYGQDAWNTAYMFPLIKHISIDSSFENYQPTSTAFWFNGFNMVEDIVGLEYLDTSRVEDMSYMFSSLSNKVTTLDLSHFDTSNVTNMSHMFSGIGDVEIDLSSFDTRKVTNMSFMFDGSRIKQLDLSTFDMTNVEDISYMFYACDLKTIYCANEQVDWSSIPYSESAFEYCDYLVGKSGSTTISYSDDKITGEYAKSASLGGYFTPKQEAQCIHPEESIIIDPAVPATCTSTGLTEGSHCGVCGVVIVAQEEIAKLPHTHGEPVGAVDPTETEDGYSGDIYCTVCGTLIEQGQIIPCQASQVNDIIWHDGDIITEVTYVGGTEEDPVVIHVQGEVSITGQITLSAGYFEFRSGVQDALVQYIGGNGYMIDIKSDANATFVDVDFTGNSRSRTGTCIYNEGYRNAYYNGGSISYFGTAIRSESDIYLHGIEIRNCNLALNPVNRRIEMSEGRIEDCDTVLTPGGSNMDYNLKLKGGEITNNGTVINALTNGGNCVYIYGAEEGEEGCIISGNDQTFQISTGYSLPIFLEGKLIVQDEIDLRGGSTTIILQNPVSGEVHLTNGSQILVSSRYMLSGTDLNVFTYTPSESENEGNAQITGIAIDSETGKTIVKTVEVTNPIIWEDGAIIGPVTYVGGTEEDPVVIRVDGTVSVTGQITLSAGYFEFRSGVQDALVQYIGGNGYMIDIKSDANATFVDVDFTGNSRSRTGTCIYNEGYRNAYYNGGSISYFGTAIRSESDIYLHGIEIRNCNLALNPVNRRIEMSGGRIEDCDTVLTPGGSNMDYNLRLKGGEITNNGTVINALTNGYNSVYIYGAEEGEEGCIISGNDQTFQISKSYSLLIYLEGKLIIQDGIDLRGGSTAIILQNPVSGEVHLTNGTKLLVSANNNYIISEHDLNVFSHQPSDSQLAGNGVYSQPYLKNNQIVIDIHHKAYASIPSGITIQPEVIELGGDDGFEDVDELYRLSNQETDESGTEHDYYLISDEGTTWFSLENEEGYDLTDDFQILIGEEGTPAEWQTEHPVTSETEEGKIYFPVPGGEQTSITIEGVEERPLTLAVYSTTANCAGSVVNISAQEGPFFAGDPVTLTAPNQEEDGYVFLGWYIVTGVENGLVSSYGEQVSADPTYTFTITTDVAITAVYKAVGMAYVRIDVVNGGGYRVSTDPDTLKTGGTIRVPLGKRITVTAANDSTFLYWCNETSKILEQVSPSYTFTVTGKTTVTLVNRSEIENQAFIQFVTDYGQVMLYDQISSKSPISYPDSPVKIGYTFDYWVIEGETEEATRDRIRAKVGEQQVITLKPHYTRDETTAIVTMKYQNNGAEIADDLVQEVLVGDLFVVTVPDIEGYTFKCWTDDQGRELGYVEAYRMKIARPSTTLIAEFVEEGTDFEKLPVIVVSDLVPVDSNGTHKITVIITRAVPDGYSLEGHGLLYTWVQKNWDETTLCHDSEGNVPADVKNGKSTDTAKTGSFYGNLSVPNDEATLYVRGYMLVSEEGSGNTIYVYTPGVASASYSTIQ